MRKVELSNQDRIEILVIHVPSSIRVSHPSSHGVNLVATRREPVGSSGAKGSHFAATNPTLRSAETKLSAAAAISAIRGCNISPSTVLVTLGPSSLSSSISTSIKLKTGCAFRVVVMSQSNHSIWNSTEGVLPQRNAFLFLRVRSWFSPYILGVSEQFENLDFRDTSRNSVEQFEQGTDRRLIAAASADGVGKDFFEPCKTDELLVRIPARWALAISLCGLAYAGDSGSVDIKLASKARYGLARLKAARDLFPLL